MKFSLSKKKNYADARLSMFGTLCCLTLTTLPASAEEPERSEPSVISLHDFCTDASLSFQQRIDFFLDKSWSIINFEPIDIMNTKDWDPKNPQHSALMAVSTRRFLALSDDQPEVKRKIREFVDAKTEGWFRPLGSHPHGVTLFKDGSIVSFSHAPNGLTERPPSTVRCYFYGSFAGDESDFIRLGGIKKAEAKYSNLYRFSFSPPEDNFESYLLTVQGKYSSEVFDTTIGDTVLGRFIIDVSN